MSNVIAVHVIDAGDLSRRTLVARGVSWRVQEQHCAVGSSAIHASNHRCGAWHWSVILRKARGKFVVEVFLWTIAV